MKARIMRKTRKRDFKNNLIQSIEKCRKRTQSWCNPIDGRGGFIINIKGIKIGCAYTANPKSDKASHLAQDLFGAWLILSSEYMDDARYCLSEITQAAIHRLEPRNKIVKRRSL